MVCFFCTPFREQEKVEKTISNFSKIKLFLYTNFLLKLFLEISVEIVTHTNLIILNTSTELSFGTRMLTATKTIWVILSLCGSSLLAFSISQPVFANKHLT